MTTQMKNSQKWPPHQWLKVQRDALVSERAFQRSYSFMQFGPGCGTDGERMDQLARTSSWAKWPHAKYGDNWAEPGAARKPPADDVHGANFAAKWCRQEMMFPPLGLKPEKFLGPAEPQVASVASSASTSGTVTPSGDWQSLGLPRRWKPPDAAPMITRVRPDQIPAHKVPHPGTHLSKPTFRDPERAHRTHAANNTPKEWEIRKDFDAGQGWGDRATKSAERLGLL